MQPKPARTARRAQVSQPVARLLRPATVPSAALATGAPSATPPQPLLGPNAEAVARFQAAVEAMQRHQYAQAAGHFRTLLDAFPSERALLDRVRVYLGLCEREIQRRPTAPVTPEEKVTAATAALNDGRDADAERLARDVLAVSPDHDLALYLIAAVNARRGEVDEALTWLRRAMDVSPDVRAQARHDADFEPLRDLEPFQQLIDAPISAQSGARRQRRPRVDR
jgi:Tfp pilus assembly protein PilF